MKKDEYKILKKVNGVNYQIPLYLDEKYDNMGDMVTFDGEIEQTEQISNFTYSGNGQTIIVYNTTNVNKYKFFSESQFVIDWGDGITEVLTMPSSSDTVIPSKTHVYSVTGDVTISVTINSPWNKNNVKKTIKIPFINDYGYPEDLGTLTFNVPYTEVNGVTQDYVLDYRSITADTKPTIISFIGAGKSRLNEFKTYGNGNTYSINTTLGNTDLGNYISYNIDGLQYFDYENGYTHITGSTSGTTEYPFISETVYNGMLTRDEILLGFIDEPQIYSDIFIERGKQSIIERNLRLLEIDNIGEMEIYGGGYFKVKKQ